MASIFNSLYTGYSGLNASQVAIDTTGHNISNADVEGYTRQRVRTSAVYPNTTASVSVGNGVKIDSVDRVFDNFVFDQYSDISADKEYSDFETKTLETASTYFPEVDDVGIKNDLSDYYDLWQDLADNPDNDSVKIALAKQSETLTNHIQSTQDQVQDLQTQVNDELAVNVDEVNSLAKELANLNKAIDKAEAGDGNPANDLRDRRNVIEKDLSRLIGAERTTDQLTSNIQIDSDANIRTGSYTVQVNGYNIVDGSTYHPIHIDKDENAGGFYEISYERQDGSLIPMDEDITGGRIGSILDLRGHTIDKDSGHPTDGVLQGVSDELDSFAKGLIQTTNNLYAASPTTRFDSNKLDMQTDTPLVNTNNNIKTGSFNIIVYDVDGNEVAKKEMKIDSATSLTSSSTKNSIKDKLETNTDDNDDGNANNDVDDYVQLNYSEPGTSAMFSLDPEAESNGYTFAIVDNLNDDNDFDSGTNFAGGLGFGRFFDGENANDIKLNSALQEDPTKISAGDSTADGDNDVALNMVQQQYEDYDFTVGDDKYNETVYGMFDVIATGVGTKTNSAITRNDTINAQYNAIEMEYFSTSKVNTDEELTNLIKYQTSYGAAAKVITTIDQMMQTLLGIKQ